MAVGTGIQGYAQGAISDQTLLLRDIRDGLGVYNRTIDPLVDMMSELTTRQTLRVSQAPKSFRNKADGGRSDSSRNTPRDLNVPFATYDLSSDFTVEWLQDALSSDVMQEMETAIAGDVELVEALFWTAVFTKQTVGALGTAYQAGFYNGEVDVPNYKNNTFYGTAHYHYAGLNTTTLAFSHIQAMRIDIQQHGYGRIPGSLHLFAHSDQSDDISGLMNTNASSTILQAITSNRSKLIDDGIVNTGVVVDGVTIHITDNVPTGYLGMIATDVKPVARREHFNPAYQGLQIYSESGVNQEYPLLGQSFMRRIGFAVQHMGAGTCRQLVASTTYTNPTFRNPVE
jgi:hypothetical protein